MRSHLTSDDAFGCAIVGGALAILALVTFVGASLALWAWS